MIYYIISKSVGVNGHLLVGNKEYSEADYHYSTDSDKPECSFATGGGKFYTAVVYNSSAIYLSFTVSLCNVKIASILNLLDFIIM